VATVPIRYTCTSCGVTSGGTATFEPPALREETARTMRQLERVKEAHGLPHRDDPVGELEREVAEKLAADELVFATCPACGARNPKGVAAVRAEGRRFSLVTFVALLLLAAAAWRWPWLGLVLPALDALVARPVALVALLSRGLVVPWARFLALVAADLALAAVVLFVPLLAPLPALAAAVLVLMRKGGDESSRFTSAAATLHFDAPRPA
jgi:hypothetical protein